MCSWRRHRRGRGAEAQPALLPGKAARQPGGERARAGGRAGGRFIVCAAAAGARRAGRSRRAERAEAAGAEARDPRPSEATSVRACGCGCAPEHARTPARTPARPSAPVPASAPGVPPGRLPSGAGRRGRLGEARRGGASFPSPLGRGSILLPGARPRPLPLGPGTLRRARGRPAAPPARALSPPRPAHSAKLFLLLPSLPGARRPPRRLASPRPRRPRDRRARPTSLQAGLGPTSRPEAPPRPPGVARSAAAMPSVMEKPGAGSGILSRSRAKTAPNGGQPHSEDDSSEEEHSHGEPGRGAVHPEARPAPAAWHACDLPPHPPPDRPAIAARETLPPGALPRCPGWGAPGAGLCTPSPVHASAGTLQGSLARPPARPLPPSRPG